MNVLHLCTKVPYPPKDGGSLAIIAFTGLLRLCNFNVTLLAANTPKHFQAVLESPDEGVTLVAVPVNTNLKVVSLGLNYLFSGLPYHVSRFKSQKYANQLKELLEKKPFYIIKIEADKMKV
jgi:hypothetical protein